jgi:hypothetical protein
MKPRNVVAAALAVVSLAGWAAPSAAQSAPVCYDLDNQVVGTMFRRGDVIPTNFGSVRINDFYIDGVLYVSQASFDNQYMKVSQSKLALGESPEMHVSLVNVQFLPSQALRAVTMKVAQQVGVNNRLPANLEVNGERFDLRGSLMAANDLQPTTADFIVALVPDDSTEEDPSYWHRGTLEVRAHNSSVISTFSLGFQAGNFDAVCLHY